MRVALFIVVRNPTPRYRALIRAKNGDGMHLKAIELENFKSFKGEAVIPYELGFTAITGPNGKGRSTCVKKFQFE